MVTIILLLVMIFFIVVKSEASSITVLYRKDIAYVPFVCITNRIRLFVNAFVSTRQLLLL